MTTLKNDREVMQALIDGHMLVDCDGDKYKLVDDELCFQDSSDNADWEPCENYFYTIVGHRVKIMEETGIDEKDISLINAFQEHFCDRYDVVVRRK